MPKNDAQGVLQDVHRSIGAIGYFATYSIGSAFSYQLAHHIENEL
jgi:carboxypeptidase Taq